MEFCVGGRCAEPKDHARIMKCLAVSQDELIIRTLAAVLLPSFEIEFIVESAPLARRLHDAGIEVAVGDPRRVDTYLRADITPNTCVIVEDTGRRSPKRVLDAVRDAGGTVMGFAPPVCPTATLA